jgi:ankyrin repeat protein
MAQLYLEHHAYLLDWPNMQGMSALHQAALKGNEAFVRVCIQSQSPGGRQQLRTWW